MWIHEAFNHDNSTPMCDTTGPGLLMVQRRMWFLASAIFHSEQPLWLDVGVYTWQLPESGVYTRHRTLFSLYAVVTTGS